MAAMTAALGPQPARGHRARVHGAQHAMPAALTVLTVLALLASSCGVDRLRVIASPPDDVDFVAAIFFDADGAMVSSTPLLAHEAGQPLRGFYQKTPSDLEHAQLAGWSRASLAAILPADHSAIERANVRIAAEEDPELPSPDWSASATIAGDVAMVVEGPLRRALTAAWLPACPKLALPELPPLVDIRCADTPQAAVVTQNDCTFAIDLRSGGLARTDGHLDGRGRLIADPGGCTVVPTDPVAAISLDCGGCIIDVYTREDRSRFTASRIDVVPGVPLHEGERGSGYVSDLAVVGSDVAVLSHGGRIVGPALCDTAPPDLLFFDRETLQASHRSTVPECAIAFVFDDARRELIVLITGVTPALARFDGSGRELSRVPFDDPRLLDGDHVPISMAITSDRLRLAVAWTETATPASTFIAAHDLASLELTGVVEIPHPGRSITTE